MTKVLISLPSHMYNFVTAWESMESSRQTYDELMAQLLMEEERAKSKCTEGEESVALYAGINRAREEWSRKRLIFQVWTRWSLCDPV